MRGWIEGIQESIDFMEQNLTQALEIPKFWDEWMAQGEKRPILGTFGLCLDMDGKEKMTVTSGCR